MNTQKPVVPKVRKAQKKRSNHYPNGRCLYIWKNNPLFAVVKAVLGARAELVGGSTLALERNFKDLGLKEPVLFEYCHRMFPWFRKYFKEVTGRVLNKHTVYMRMYMQFKTVSGDNQRSREHYQHDALYRNILTKIEGVVLKDEPLSREQTLKLSKGLNYANTRKA